VSDALAGYRRHQDAIDDRADLYLSLADVAGASGDDRTAVAALDTALDALFDADSSDASASPTSIGPRDCRESEDASRDTAARREKRDVLIASALANGAAARMRLSRFREAHAQFPRWQEVVQRLSTGQEATESVQRGAAVFASLHRILHRPETASELVESAQRLRCDPVAAGDIAASLEVEAAEVELIDGCLHRAVEFLGQINETALTDAVVRASYWLARSTVHEVRGEFVESAVLVDRVIGSTDVPRGIRNEARSRRSRNLSLRRQSLTSRQEARELVHNAETEGDVASFDMACAVLALAESLAAGVGLVAVRPIGERALRLFEMVLGPRHPNTADALRVLAESAWATGDTDCGLQFCDEADRNSNEGPTGMIGRARTAAIRGRLLQQQGQISAGRREFQCALAGYAQLLPDEGRVHPETGFVQLDLAMAAIAEGVTDEAVIRQADAEVLLLGLFGRFDLLAFECVRRGNVFYETRRYVEAVWLYRRAMELYEQSLGTSHSFTNQATQNLEKALNKLKGASR
jgi:tetratricopeptide (TPR) repeat protein